MYNKKWQNLIIGKIFDKIYIFWRQNPLEPSY